MSSPNIMRTTRNRVLDNIAREDGKPLLQIEAKISGRPIDTSWSLTNVESDELIWSQGPYDALNIIHNHQKCVESDAGCVFAIFDYYGDFNTGQYCKLKINNMLVKHITGRLSFYSQDAIMRSEYKHCNDNNSCTVCECNSNTKQCSCKAGTCVVEDGCNRTCDPQTLECSSFTSNQCNECSKKLLQIEAKTSSRSTSTS